MLYFSDINLGMMEVFCMFGAAEHSHSMLDIDKLHTRGKHTFWQSPLRSGRHLFSRHSLRIKWSEAQEQNEESAKWMQTWQRFWFYSSGAGWIHHLCSLWHGQGIKSLWQIFLMLQENTTMGLPCCKIPVIKWCHLEKALQDMSRMEHAHHVDNQRKALQEDVESAMQKIERSATFSAKESARVTSMGVCGA